MCLIFGCSSARYTKIKAEIRRSHMSIIAGPPTTCLPSLVKKKQKDGSIGWFACRTQASRNHSESTPTFTYNSSPTKKKKRMKKLTRCHCIHPRICRWHPPTPTPTLIILRACRGSKKKTEGFHFQNCKFPSLTSRRHCCYHLRHLHRLLLLDRSFPPPRALVSRTKTKKPADRIWRPIAQIYPPIECHALFPLHHLLFVLRLRLSLSPSTITRGRSNKSMILKNAKRFDKLHPPFRSIL